MEFQFQIYGKTGKLLLPLPVILGNNDKFNLSGLLSHFRQSDLISSVGFQMCPL